MLQYKVCVWHSFTIWPFWANFYTWYTAISLILVRLSGAVPVRLSAAVLSYQSDCLVLSCITTVRLSGTKLYYHSETVWF